MKRITLTRISSVISCIALLLACSSVSVSANSAQTHWSGVSSTGAIITVKDCPLEVKKELLTFDIQEFPLEYYSAAEDYLAYTGKVTAEYTFYNPADYTVTATLLFPFGKIPDYGYMYDYENNQRVYNADTEKYGITVDGKDIETKLRHTLSDSFTSFDLHEDLPKLMDNYVEDDFYHPDMPVTKYTYSISGIDEQYTAAHAAFVWSGDKMKTRVLLEEQNGGKTLKDGYQLEMWVKNGDTATLYLIGEVPAPDPSWTFYENGACEDKIEGTMTLLDSETMTFQELALTSYEESSGISEIDWYNALVFDFIRYAQNYGIIRYSGRNLDVSRSLLRWYEYEITVAPGETIMNTVTAPLYPSINSSYEPAIYSYIYLLSPAQTWAKFGNLNIVIHTPYYITESNMDDFTKTDNGYELSLDGLPRGELEFTLCASAEPSKPARTLRDYIPIEIIISFSIIGGVMLTIIGGITAFVLIRRKRQQKAKDSLQGGM